jgi:hypothetical protein
VSDLRRNHEATYYVGPPDPEYIAEWQANLQARKLYDRGVNFPALAVVMAEYHGIERGPSGWREQIRKQGAKPRPCRRAEVSRG